MVLATSNIYAHTSSVALVSIQLNKSNYSLCLSFHGVVSIWMKFRLPLTSLETKVIIIQASV